jgi:molybdopterin synthase catalytic subunit
LIEITRKPIDVQKVIDSVQSDDCGALVTFIGTVRDNSESKKVLYLEYDVYPEMAEKKLTEIASEIKSKWGLENVSMVHRVGRLEIGEIVVVIAIASGHRQEGFQASQYAIDRLKEMVPIWKKEFYAEGSSAWIGHP